MANKALLTEKKNGCGEEKMQEMRSEIHRKRALCEELAKQGLELKASLSLYQEKQRQCEMENSKITEKCQHLSLGISHENIDQSSYKQQVLVMWSKIEEEKARKQELSKQLKELKRNSQGQFDLQQKVDSCLLACTRAQDHQ